MKKQMLVTPQSNMKCDGNQVYHGITKFKTASVPQVYKVGTMEMQCL